MTPSRREFVASAVGVGLGAIGGRGQEVSASVLVGDGGQRRSESSPSHRPAPKTILILGGTGFIGPHMVRYAVDRGHEVTIFTRGRTSADLPDVEQLTGDRNDDLSALEGRRWDVVLDNNSRDYRWVELSAGVLKNATDHYLLVSSISAYDPAAWSDHDGSVVWDTPVDERNPLHTPGNDWSHGDEAHYGLTKALAEGIVHETFPGRGTVVRPGLIVGPGDRTDRFTYWPVRINEGGNVLAPGNPDHANQIIDQRDLTEWIVRLAEDSIMGDFNGTGPTTRLSMAEMLYGIRAATSSPVEFTWVSESFLEEHAVRPWSDLPSWIPGDPLMNVSIERALASGLTFRPLAVTARDTIDWYLARPEEERANPRAGLSRERERELLELWRQQSGP